jgi:hypothetical protein
VPSAVGETIKVALLDRRAGHTGTALLQAIAALRRERRRWVTYRLPWVMLLLALLAGGVRAGPAEDHAVAAIVAGRLTVATPAGQGALPLHVSQEWSRPLPQVTRALLVVHGALRDADVSLRITRAALYAAGESGSGTMTLVPQFLAEPDAVAHAVPAGVLRWSNTGWIDGEAATGPAPLSSFDALDAILARLVDPIAFPNLRQLVIAGHSAGAQLVQRYAVVGRGAEALAHAGIAVRYVVANPSSYLWFGEGRPVPASQTVCETVDHWAYGLTGAPGYVAQTEGLEVHYIARDVVYLLGEADVDANHPLLDRSCAAQAQGLTRYARGMNYLFALEQRHPNLVRHRVLNVWGVGHDATSMFVSPCGVAALFDRPGC